MKVYGSVLLFISAFYRIMFRKRQTRCYGMAASPVSTWAGRGTWNMAAADSPVDGRRFQAQRVHDWPLAPASLLRFVRRHDMEIRDDPNQQC